MINNDMINIRDAYIRNDFRNKVLKSSFMLIQNNQFEFHCQKYCFKNSLMQFDMILITHTYLINTLEYLLWSFEII